MDLPVANHLGVLQVENNHSCVILKTLDIFISLHLNSMAFYSKQLSRVVST